MQIIQFVTWNPWKFSEAKVILWDDIILEQVDIDLNEIQTTSVAEVIEHKVREGYSKLQKPLIVEDTWLEIIAWNWLPGALIKFFLKWVWAEWIIKMLENYSNKKARAVCCIWYFDWEKLEIFEWEAFGEIAPEVRWDNWFWWDKIFIPDWYSETFAEMLKEEKNKISARKMAFEKFREFAKLF